jgi:hypothetical protein
LFAVVVGFQSKVKVHRCGRSPATLYHKRHMCRGLPAEVPVFPTILLSQNKLMTKRTRGILNFLKQRNCNCFASHDGVMRKERNNRYPPMASLANALKQFVRTEYWEWRFALNLLGHDCQLSSLLGRQVPSGHLVDRQSLFRSDCCDFSGGHHRYLSDQAQHQDLRRTLDLYA